MKATTIILLLLMAVPRCHGAVNAAATGSWADVSNAVRISVTGDTVTIPVGSNLWGGPIILTNGIAIRGSGTNSCIISNDQVKVDGKEMPSLLVEMKENAPLTISHIRFEGVLTIGKEVNEGGCAIRFDPPPVLPTKVRVTSCYFGRFSKALYLRQGGAFGVADHNYFENNYQVLRDVGFWETNGTVWIMVTNAVGNTPWPWNTTNTFVLEDNHIAWLSWANGIYVADTEGPATYTLRHNTIDMNRTIAATLEGCDMHNIPQENFVFNVGIKEYKNTFNVTGSTTVNPTRYANIRGGGGSLVYSNTVTGINGSIMFSRNIDIGPYLTNSYTWENYGTGGAAWVVNTGSPPYDGPVVNVNFFTNPPADFSELTYPHPLANDVKRTVKVNKVKVGQVRR